MAFQNLWIVITKISLYVVKRHKSIKYRTVIADQTMFSAAEEVIFALRTQGMSQKGIAARVGCSQSTVSRILKKDFPAPVNNGGRPKKTSPQDDRGPLRELPTPIASNRPPASLTCGTRQWHHHHLFQGQQLTSGCGSMVFQAGYPALSLSYPANRRKNVYSLHRSIPSGRWRTGSKSSSLMNRNSSRDLVFGGKSTKGTRWLVWSALSSIRPPLWSGDACHPEELEVCASCLPKTTVNTEVYIDLLDAYLLPSVDKLFADDWWLCVPAWPCTSLSLL